MGCKTLDVNVSRLRSENVWLRRKLDIKLNRVKRQKKFLDVLRTFVWYQRSRAKKVLDQPSGVKRMDWAYARGVGYASGILYEVLVFDYSVIVQDLL